MPFRKHQGDIRPGMVSETGTTESTVEASPDAMAYPGFIPPAYTPPLPPYMQADGGGYSAVPNNTDRGTESHGVQVNAHVGPKDSRDAVAQTEKSDRNPQLMPEADDNAFEYEPIKVEIVNQDPDEITRIQTNTVTIVPTANTATGSAAPTGITPIRILGKDPHRTKAYIQTVAWTSGGNSANGIASLPVILASENQPPVYGFPLATGAAATLNLGSRIEILATDEVWVSGQNAADAGIISVYIERTTNADRLYGD